jgi:hypothetical protein
MKAKIIFIGFLIFMVLTIFYVYFSVHKKTVNEMDLIFDGCKSQQMKSFNLNETYEKDVYKEIILKCLNMATK